MLDAAPHAPQVSRRSAQRGDASRRDGVHAFSAAPLRAGVPLAAAHRSRPLSSRPIERRVERAARSRASRGRFKLAGVWTLHRRPASRRSTGEQEQLLEFPKCGDWRHAIYYVDLFDRAPQQG